MHILFITEKWCDCNPDRGLSNAYHNLFGSLESTGLASFSIFHPDEYVQQNQREYFTPLMFYIFQTKPDVIIATWYSTDILELFKQVIEKIGVPIVPLWWDSVSQMHLAEAFLPYAAFSIVMDSREAYKTSESPGKYLPLWTPQDPRIFNNPKLVRDIDVSFAGSMAGHPFREECIKLLRSSGIKVLQTGGQREQRLPIKDYADVYKRSRIVINFSDSPKGIPQLKGRIFEAMLSGAMLMESENKEIEKYFEPMKSYVPFDRDHVAGRAQYYLSHDKDREAVASEGQRIAEENYSAEKFWSIVINKVKSL